MKRRFFASAVPQDFHAEVPGTPVCVFEQQPTPFSFRVRLRFLPVAAELLDPRFVVAAAVLPCLVEGRQRRHLSSWDFCTGEPMRQLSHRRRAAPKGMPELPLMFGVVAEEP